MTTMRALLAVAALLFTLGSAHAVQPNEVLKDQALERRGLIWCVVIDMHSRMRRQPVHDLLNDLVECPFLVRGVDCPTALINRLTVAAKRGKTEEVLAPAIASERIAFEIQKDISWRRVWQPAQACVWLNWH